MNNRLAEPDYQLVIPRAVFVAEAALLLTRRTAADWNDRCELLLDDAFIRGFDGGPLAEFRELPSVVTGDPWATDSRNEPSHLFTEKQLFLRELMDGADHLLEDPARRPYWRERHGPSEGTPALDAASFSREFVALIGELEDYGYFAKRFGKDCVDDPYGDLPAQVIRRELRLNVAWPLDPAELVVDQSALFDVIELLHDLAARPRTRSLHSYGGCGWHYSSYDIQTGRQVYRWRVNRLLVRSDLGLRLADEGVDAGRLVTITDEGRGDLIRTAAARDAGDTASQVRHAIELFRSRSANRNDKRSAVAALALVLEERRRNVLTEVLAKSDRGAIFEIANGFHIRHQDAKQKRDYDDFYLDWIFWLYLSTVELTDRVIDEQARQ